MPHKDMQISGQSYMQLQSKDGDNVPQQLRFFNKES